MNSLKLYWKKTKLWYVILTIALFLPLFYKLYNFYFLLWGVNASSIWNCSSENCVKKTLCSLDTFWSALTAITAIVAVWCAKKAYDESINSRNYNAFFTMFTQLIKTQVELLQDTRLRCVKEKNIEHNKQKNVFHDFICYYENRTKDTDLSIDRIAVIWNDFYKLISNKYDFSKCFKYIYHEIDIILEFEQDIKESGVKDSKKTDRLIRHYAQLIQGNMNKDELFCYFINLLVFFHEHGCDTESRNAHLDFLIKYDFFQDICRKSKRGTHYLMMERIKNILREHELTKFVEMIQ